MKVRTGKCLDCDAVTTATGRGPLAKRCKEHTVANRKAFYRSEEYRAWMARHRQRIGYASGAADAPQESCGEGYDPSEAIAVHLPAGWQPRTEIHGEPPQEDGRARGPFSPPRYNERLRFDY